MARRKAGSSHTTISITWSDIELFRWFAKLVMKTRNWEMYESDSAVFHKILEEYVNDHKNLPAGEPHSTYPTKDA